MIKGFRQIASLTALSRVFGLVRDVCYFYFFGASGLLDAWFIAFKIPNLSRRLFGEGAASASFIPVYSHELEKDRREASRLANTVVTTIVIILTSLVVVGWLGILLYNSLLKTTSETRLILSLTSVMLPYMILVCSAAILAGILHVHRHFAAPAAAPIVLNIFIIATLGITGFVFKLEPAQQVYITAFSVLAAGFVQIGLQILPLRSKGLSIRPAWQVRSDAFKKIIIMMGPMILGLTATQINTLFDDLIAWWFSGSAEKGATYILFGKEIAYPLYRGCVSHLNAAQRLYQLPLGVFGIALATAIFPVLSSYAAKNDRDGLRETISKGINGAIFIALPATVGLIFITKPLVSTLFEHGRFTYEDTKATAFTLPFYTLGLTGYFIQQIVTRSFYSIQDSKTPMRSALVVVFINIVLNIILIWPLGTAGLACSTAVCSYLQCAILIWFLRKKLGDGILEGTFSSLLKIIAATLLMALSLTIVLQLMRDLSSTFLINLLRLIISVLVGSIVYILAAKLLRIEMLSMLLSGQKKGIKDS
ncbi:MAG: murein biosynthesis integral membrane protein MurJ [Planctomycetota bacterium]|jgi:putative peptidoglycan lipid II flippase